MVVCVCVCVCVRVQTMDQKKDETLYKSFGKINTEFKQVRPTDIDQQHTANKIQISVGVSVAKSPDVSGAGASWQGQAGRHTPPSLSLSQSNGWMCVWFCARC